MANRSYVRNTMSLERNPVALYAKVNIGASGAPTLVSAQCQGIYSMSRTGTGAYTINLGMSASSLDSYRRLLMLSFQTIKGTASSVATIQVVADNSATVAGPNVTILCLDFAGAAVDPANGEVLLLKLELSNSSAI